MREYTKYKECSPEETIFRIRGILHEAGLFPVLNWGPEEFQGVCSNRVYLDPVYGLGSNGKGTNARYAEASAFAELMERLQNHLLHIKNFGPGESRWPISASYPDEKEMSFAELIDQGDVFFKSLFSRLGFALRFQQMTFLESMAASQYDKHDGKIPAIPFADMNEHRVVWLPASVVISFCGSNGMCAGNSMEEALVQGFSEILERYAQMRILREGLTPPQISAAELEQYTLWPLIKKIEASGRYRVSVRDCSLGMGLPVTAVVIADRERNTFGVKFGCHPSFPISVERTLTEAFQGKKLEHFTSTNVVGSESDVCSYDNYANTAKTGAGYYPAAFLGSSPSWEYRPWTEWESTGNREYLCKLLALLDRMGYVPLIRDASHLGFPSYFIVIPGMSEMYDVNHMRLRDLRTSCKVKNTFGHFPDLSKEEEDLLFRLMIFKQGSIIENGLDVISGRFLKGDLFITDRVGAYLALKSGAYANASLLFQRASLACQQEEDRRYMTCMAVFSNYLGNGISRDAALDALRFLFEEELVKRADEETCDPAAMMGKVFPRLRCYDCEHCALAGVHCDYPEAAKILQKINRVLEKSTVSQEKLLEKLEELEKVERL